MANKPNNPELWSRAKSMAKQKFDVYPSAYANGWAAKWYKSKGGTWRKAQKGEEIKIDGEKYNTDTPLYRRLYNNRSIASVDEQGIPNLQYPEVEITAKRIPLEPVIIPYDDYNKKTFASKAWETEKKVFPQAVEDSNNWYKSWYKKRMELPEFKKVASDRYNAVLNKQIPIILQASPIFNKEHRGGLAVTYPVDYPFDNNKKNKIFIGDALGVETENDLNYYNR